MTSRSFRGLVGVAGGGGSEEGWGYCQNLQTAVVGQTESSPVPVRSTVIFTVLIVLLTRPTSM